MLSPSRQYDGIPWPTRYDSSANDMVVFPAPESPKLTNQDTQGINMYTSQLLTLNVM